MTTETVTKPEAVDHAVMHEAADDFSGLEKAAAYRRAAYMGETIALLVSDVAHLFRPTAEPAVVEDAEA